ncbi:MAG: 5'-deoxynucleotidase [Christensenellales bacterium]
MYHFFAYLSRMKYINRWSLMRNTRTENIQEHSQQVAVLAHMLATIRNLRFGGNVDTGRVTELAVFHETSEVITGDLPTPIKYYNPQIHSAYKDIESEANRKLLAMLPEDMANAYENVLASNEVECLRLVKAADKLSAYLKCVEEMDTGNRDFDKAAQSIRRELNAMKDVPEIEVFFAEYEPSYHLTLDELN